MFLYCRNLEVFIHSSAKFINNSIRYHRIYKGRKRVQIEPNKASRYLDKRQVPSTLIKGNLFTPESAGLRELSMLCYWIVSYGYADSFILNRYVQCAIEKLPKLKIKSIALIFHSLSKYCTTFSDVTVGYIQDPVDPNGGTGEEEAKNNLLRSCLRLIEESSPLLPRLVVRGIPKDLGMISLSIVNLYEIIKSELELDTKRLNTVIERLMHLISDELRPKLPFCNMEEYVAFAQAYSKLAHLDWCRFFLKELSVEVSSLLLEKMEEVKDLLNGVYIGDELMDFLVKLPRELTTVTCSMSKCKIKENIFWERSMELVKLMLELDGKEGIFGLDVPTLTLLSTSMMNNVNVLPIIEKIAAMETKDEDLPALITCFDISVRCLNDLEMGELFFNKFPIDIDLTSLSLVNKIQFINSVCRKPIGGELRDNIRQLLSSNVPLDLLITLFINKKRLEFSVEEVDEMAKTLLRDVNAISIKHFLPLINILDAGQYPHLTNSILKRIDEKINEIEDQYLIPFMYSLTKHGTAADLILKIAKRLRKSSMTNEQLDFIADQLESVGINPKFVQKRRSNELPQPEDSYDLTPNLCEYDMITESVSLTGGASGSKDEVDKIVAAMHEVDEDSGIDVGTFLEGLHEDQKDEPKAQKIKISPVLGRVSSTKRLVWPRGTSSSNIRDEWTTYRHAN